MSTKYGKVFESMGKLPAEQETEADQAGEGSTAKKLGRPRGKKSNPDYSQVTVYLRRDVHVAAKKLLLDEQREFSDLVDELVSKWNFQKSKSSKV